MKKYIKRFMVDSVKNHQLISLLILPALLILSNISCSDQSNADAKFSMPPMPVEVAYVTEQKMSDNFEAIGTIEAIEEISAL